jgi:hypothetical protein
MKKIIEWMNYHLFGGKEKIKKESILKLYRDQKDFAFMIDPLDLISGGRYRYRAYVCRYYVCRYSVDGGDTYINIGDVYYKDVGKGHQKMYVSSYDRGLQLCLREFERYLETKKKNER